MPDANHIADEATDEIFKERAKMQANNQIMRKSHVRDIIARVVAAHWPAPALKAPPRRKPYNMMTEEEFIACLESEPSLAGLDVKREIGRCQFWCKTNGVAVTRNRVLNWVRKADRTVAFNGAGASSKAKGTAVWGIPEPDGWKEWLDANRPESVYATGMPMGFKQWQDLDYLPKKYISDEMAKERQHA
jgi:hypothetical protein